MGRLHCWSMSLVIAAEQGKHLSICTNTLDMTECNSGMTVCLACLVGCSGHSVSLSQRMCFIRCSAADGVTPLQRFLPLKSLGQSGLPHCAKGQDSCIKRC